MTVRRMLLTGLAGGLLGAVTTNLYTRAISTITRGHEARGAAPGLNRAGRGMQPAQAITSADRDAAVLIGSMTYELITGRTPAPSSRTRLGSAAHYAFSASAGVFYAVMARQHPSLRSGLGMLYGLLVWAIADEGIVPALGLSRSPYQLSSGVHVYSLIGHAVFGATLEGVRAVSDRSCSAEATRPTRPGRESSMRSDPSGMETPRTFGSH